MLQPFIFGKTENFNLFQILMVVTWSIYGKHFNFPCVDRSEYAVSKRTVISFDLRSRFRVNCASDLKVDFRAKSPQ